MSLETKENWVYFGRVAINLAQLHPDRARLDPEAKRTWIDALWFGFYKQGTRVLCDMNNNFCCLGVKHIIEGDSSEFISLQRDYFGQDKCVLGPTGRVESAKVASVFLNGKSEISLAQLNDAGATFREIAFVIEHVF
jgi:hypothetical protein